MVELKVTKKEFNLMTQIIHPGLFKVRQEYKRGIQMLFDARNVLAANLYNHFSTLWLIFKSKVLDKDKLFSANLNSIFNLPENLSIEDAWGITKSPNTIIWDCVPEDIIRRYWLKRNSTSTKPIEYDIGTYTVW